MPAGARRRRGHRTRLGLVVTLIAVLTTGCRPADTPFDRLVRDDLTYAANRVAATESSVPASVYPQETDASGAWKSTPPAIWTSGFQAGLDWELYQATGSPVWRALAQVRQSGVETQDVNTTDHDIGFKIFDSFGNGFRLTGNPSSKPVLLTAADHLATLYDPDVGCLLSWGDPKTDFKVVIDSVMNLELLLWASKNGGSPTLRNIAITHARHLQTDHVRADGSTFHAVWYNPTTGEILKQGTIQGNRDGSTWSRGQAWAVHGFTMLYRETGDTGFLATARRTADWWLAHVPHDMVPYWDFDFTDGSSEPRDSSAAAIAASGLLELARLDPDPARANRYLTGAIATLTSLSSHAYRSDGTGSQAILLHGTRYKNDHPNDFDTGLIFGDYYFVEALLRLRGFAPTTTPLPVRGVVASASEGNPATNTIDGNLQTRWSAAGDGQWIQYDLGSSQNVNKVGIALYLGNQRTSRFDIQTSTDGATWTTRLGSVSSGATDALETYDISDVSARYVRVVGHGNSVDTENAITEVAIY
jgi:unsaturated chondroitin disaccharide hydrolase